MSDCQLPNKRAQYEPKPIVYGMAKNGTPMRIQLDDKEASICELLRQVSDFVAAERPDLPRIESRIAGGWVRDKVRNKLSTLDDSFMPCSFLERIVTIWILQ